MKRRGFVLIAVLVIVGCALFIATSIVFLVGGEVAGSSNAIEALRLRSAAWSGVQAVAARLSMQRNRALAGAIPMVDPIITLWETSDEVATARLLPIDPDGARVIAEAGRIDLRTATVEALVASGGVDEDLAKRLVAARDALGGGALQPESLLAVGAASLTAEDLYGPIDGMRLGLDEDADIKSGDALERLLGGAAPRGAADLVTGFAEDPPLTSAGTARIALSGEWNDDKRRAIDAALGAGASTLLEGASKSDVDYGNLFAAWRARNPEPRTWVSFLDATVADDRPAQLGRLDIMHASPAALRSLPGIDDERAARIVRERETVSEDARRSPAWLVERGIVTSEEFVGLVGRVTTRSLYWRVRIAVTVDGPRGSEISENAEESGRVEVLEAVIDLSSARPRVAMLRDVSSLETAARLIAEMPPREREDDRAPIDETPADVAPAPVVEQAPPMSDDPDAAAPRPAPPIERSAGRWRPTR